MRAAVVILAALGGTAHADAVMRFGGGVLLRSGHEPGVLDEMPVAYPYDDKGAAFQFDADIVDVVPTDRGGALGVRFGGGFEYVSRTSTLPDDGVPDGLGDTVSFTINGGTLLPLIDREAWSLQAHGSVDVWMQGALDAGLDVGVRLRSGAQRLEYDLRPFRLRENRLEHRATIVVGAGSLGLRAEARLGDDRTRDGGYRYHAFVLGIEVRR